MADEEDAQWRRARREAVATLRSALGWSLPSEQWDQVRDILAEVAAAVSAAAPAALSDATETLSFYMPVRVGTRLGDDPAVPVPGFVREQIAELVDTLEPYPTGGHEQAARRGA